MVTLGWLSFLWLARAEIGLNREFGWATLFCIWGLPKWLSGKESACSAGDTDSIPGSGRCAGDRNGNPLQYSCLENSMDRGAWGATVHGVRKRWAWLSLSEWAKGKVCGLIPVQWPVMIQRDSVIQSLGVNILARNLSFLLQISSPLWVSVPPLVILE